MAVRFSLKFTSFFLEGTMHHDPILTSTVPSTQAHGNTVPGVGLWLDDMIAGSQAQLHHPKLVFNLQVLMWHLWPEISGFDFLKAVMAS